MTQRNSGDSTALRLARQGSFWVGIDRKQMPYGTIAAGQSFVQFFIPEPVRHRYPILMIHGGGGQMTHFMGIGRRPGWLHYALQAGYMVYLVDRPGYGRAPYHPDALGPGQLRPFLTFEVVPQIAGRGKEWPGSGIVGQDGLIADFAAGEVGNVAEDDLPMHSELCARGLAEVVDRIGRCIVLTFAYGGYFGWKLADDRPGQIAAIVAAEVNGWPFGTQTPWGLTAIPMTFDPPVSDPSQFNLVERTMPADWPGPLRPFKLQAEPARRLPNLANVPIVSVVNRYYTLGSGPAQVEFLKQAGCTAEVIRLWERGFPNNTNLMPIEKNNRQIFDVILNWLQAKVPDEV
jgi:pimeloyl-ACP methyl ester carboxylesterase